MRHVSAGCQSECDIGRPIDLKEFGVNDPKQPSQDPADQAAAEPAAGNEPTAHPDTAPNTPERDPSSAPAPLQPEPRRSWSGLLFVLWLSTLLAGGYGGWWLWQQQQNLQQELAEQNQRWVNAAQHSSQQLQSLEQQISAEQRERAALSTLIHALQAELMALAETQQQGNVQTEQDTLLTDVSFLLRSARHIGLLTGDLPRVEALLEQANEQLQASQRLALLPIREALNQDLQHVRGLPRTDVDEVFLQLGALAQDAQQWQWWPGERLQFLTEPTREQATTSWQAAWQELRSLVRIHERSEQRFETLDAASFEQARNQYRLFLLQAQSALLLGQQQAFEYSLEQALAWLDSFSEQIPQHPRIRSQLESIQALSVVRQTPDIRRALEQLQQLQRSGAPS